MLYPRQEQVVPFLQSKFAALKKFVQPTRKCFTFLQKQVVPSVQRKVVPLQKSCTFTYKKLFIHFLLTDKIVLLQKMLFLLQAKFVSYNKKTICWILFWYYQ